MTSPTITNTRTNQTFDTISAAAAAAQNGDTITVQGSAPPDPANPPPPITINWTEGWNDISLTPVLSISFAGSKISDSLATLANVPDTLTITTLNGFSQVLTGTPSELETAFGQMVVPIGLNDKITLTVTNPAGFSTTVTIEDTSSTISSETPPSAPAPTPAVTPAV